MPRECRGQRNVVVLDTILGLLDSKLICKTSTGESEVFYQMRKAGYDRYIAVFTKYGAMKLVILALAFGPSTRR